MKGKSFVLSALILALGGFFAKAIGALYKIPLTNILGSNGMGLYYLIFPIYSLIITFCSSGINVALATEVAKCRRSRNRYNEQKLLRVALVFSFVLSFIFSIIIVFISRPLAEAQGNVNAKLGYIAIAPAIIISSMIATLRGYFQGVENMVPTTVSMIVEQIAKLSVGLILAHKLCVYGIQFAVLGAIIGVTISEVIALIIISINFFTYRGQLFYNYKNKFYKSKNYSILKRKNKVKLIIEKAFKIRHRRYKCSSKLKRYTTISAIKKLTKTLAPATFSSIIIPIATMLDSFMIINLLVGSGYSSLISTSLYGLWGGVVQSLISLPTILIAGISTSIVPSLSGVVAGQNDEQIYNRVKFFIKLTLMLGIIMFVMFFVFAEDILYFLYGNGLNSNVIDELYYATKMLKVSSISILYYSLLQTFTAILQSIGKPHIPFIAMLIGLVLRTVLIVILVQIPNINIFGGIIANAVFISLVSVLLAIGIKTSIKLKFRLFQNLILPIVLGAIILCIMLLCHRGLSEIIGYFASMVITAIIGLIGFVLGGYFSKIFDIREKKMFFFRGKKLTKTSK